MRSFSFVGKDLKQISTRADKFSRCVDCSFPPQVEGAEIRKLYYEDIAIFKQKHNVVVYWDEFGVDGIPDGMVVRIELDEPVNGADAIYLISIDKSIDSLTGPAKSRALKEAFLHEISHLILQHPGLVMPSNEKLVSADLLSDMAVSYTRFFVDEKSQNLDAELMSLTLGFWPQAEFTRLVKATRADFRQIANEYKMTVESALQWAVVRFDGILDAHYMKGDEGTKDIVDWYGKVEECSNVFDEPGTVAGRAVKDKCDAKSNSSLANYECRAYYEKKETFHDHKDDEVLVIGFRKDNYESFVIPGTRPEVQPPY